MSRFTTQQRAAWSDAESAFYLAAAVGAIEAKDENGDPIPWHWLPLGTPTWKQLLIHHMNLTPWPVWQPVYAGFAKLDTAYSALSQTRDTGLTWREALDAVWVFADPDEN